MLSEQVKALETENENLRETNLKLAQEIVRLSKKAKEYKNCCLMVLPKKVYTHKARKNTTVKFEDGSQITVTRKAGEKDCIETAIAYCILKQLLPAADLKRLIEEREEH